LEHFSVIRFAEFDLGLLIAQAVFEGRVLVEIFLAAHDEILLAFDPLVDFLNLGGFLVATSKLFIVTGFVPSLGEAT